MKKVAFILLLSLCIFNGESFASNVFVNSPDAQLWIKIGVTFHRPKLDCKEGFGLCFDVTWGIDGGGYSAERVCPVRGSINERNQLILQVAEADLLKYENGSTLPQFKGKSSITLLDPYTFSKEVSSQLGSLTPITVKAGTYPVTYADKVYTITIQL